MGASKGGYAMRRRARSGRRALVLLVAVLLVVAGYLFLQAPAFEVHAVQVTGLVRLSAAAVASEARVADGTPLWRIRSAKVAARVLADPLVQTVHVIKHWPNKIEIAVTEREPVASVTLTNGSFAEVDSSGVVIRVDQRLSAQWPLITAPEISLAPKAVLQDDAATRALAVVVALEARPTIDFSEVHVASANAIVAYLADGTLVQFGTADHPDRQAAVLAGLLDKLGASGPRPAYISVVDPDAPVVMPYTQPSA